MKFDTRFCYVFFLTSTLIACNSDSGNSDNAGEVTMQQGTLSDNPLIDDFDSDDSIINSANFISLLRNSLYIPRTELSPFEGLIDVGEFVTTFLSDTGTFTNQPCVAGGTYDLTVTPSDDPGSEELGFINFPTETYNFTECSSASNTTISEFYESSKSIGGGFTFSDSEFSETFDATITGFVTPNGPRDISLDGTLTSLIFGSNIITSFDLDSYSASDATGTLDVTGSGSVSKTDNIDVTSYLFDMTLQGTLVNPENPTVRLTLRTEGAREDISPLEVVDGTMVSSGAVVLSAPDGSSVRAEASINESVADITLTSGGSITLDSRPWSELVP